MAPYRCLGSAEFAGVAIAAELLADSLRRLCEGSANLQAMPAHRMNRDEFYRKLAPLDEERLKKALWTLYWRGSAPMRERIEAQLDPDGAAARQRREPEPVDAGALLAEVRDFVALARKGAYLAGDRRVSPRERSRWRFTFKRLVADAEGALRGEDLDSAAAALELLVDLACETRGYEYFRSEDPMQAAGVVVSDAVARLWAAIRDQHGFAGFAERAAPQLIRWESPYGWTRYGDGRVADKERTLAAVLAGMLQAPDHWDGFAARYLEALDAVADKRASRTRRRVWSADRDRQDRAQALAEWHEMLVDRLAHSEAEGLLDRLVAHPALSGPELKFVEARLAHVRDDADRARELVFGCLEELPGHRDFHDFATRIGAPLPARAEAVRARLVG
jgi:uncharacterized protein YfiM (DUF2279 family)